MSSINRADASPTNAGTVHWTVTFSEPVTGVDATDFALVRSGVTGGSITTVTGTGPYTVTATTGSGDGTLGLNLVDDDSIVDGAGNPLGGTGTSGAGDGSFTGQVYTIDKTAPTVSTINRAAGSTNPTNTGPLAFTVTFSEPVNTAAVVGARFAVTTANVTGTAPTVGTITPISPSGGFASIYTVNVTTTGAVGADNGSVRLDLTTGGTIQDQATNGLAGTPHNGDQSFTFDTTAPTVSTINRAAGSTNPTNTGPLAFTVTFSEPVNTAAVVGARFAVTTANVTGTAPTVGTITPISPSGGFASIYTVNVTTTGAVGADNGSVRLDQASSGTIADQAGNGLSGTHNGDQSYNYDTTAPTVSTINIAGTSPTNATTLPFTVTFSEPVNTAGVVAARFAVTTANVTGTAPTVGAITPVSPSGGFATSYTVNVNATGAVGANNGSVRLDLTSVGTIQDQATNALTAVHNGDQSYNYDTTAPTVSTINIAGTSPTKAATLPFTVTFSEPVNTAAVVAARFAVTTSGVTGTAPTVGTITPVSPSGGFATSYTVNVNATGAIGANSGSVRLDLTTAGTIQDQATNGLAGTPHNGDQSYNYDTTAPTVSTINIAGTSPTNATTLPFTVTFSEPVNTAAVVAARFAVTTSGVTGTAPTVGTITPVSPSGGFATSYTVNVNATGAIGANNGSVRLDQTSSGTIADQAGNGLTGTHNGDQTYNYDTTAPTVTINQAAGQADPTGASPINFTVVFTESTTDFATGDVTLAGTAGATTATVTGSGTTYNVAVTGMTTNGTVIATLGAGVAHDAAGNANTASTSTDNTVTYQNVLTPTAVTITNGTGGTAGKAEAGDVITITWNRAIQLSSVCSSWSSDSQTVTGVTLTMNRGNGWRRTTSPSAAALSARLPAAAGSRSAQWPQLRAGLRAEQHEPELQELDRDVECDDEPTGDHARHPRQPAARNRRIVDLHLHAHRDHRGIGRVAYRHRHRKHRKRPELLTPAPRSIRQVAAPRKRPPGSRARPVASIPHSAQRNVGVRGGGPRPRGPRRWSLRRRRKGAEP